ncbi:DMT family transporter [Martelella sp. FLE1502]
MRRSEEHGGRRRIYGLILVGSGTVLWSLAGLFVRAIDLGLWDLILWRSLFACLCLVATAIASPAEAMHFDWRFCLAACFSAAAMFCYVAALTMTTVANVLIIYATLPFVTAALAFAVGREAASTRLLMASSLSMIGIVLVAGTSSGMSDIKGNILALAMTLSFGALLILTRRRRALNIVHVNAAGAALCAVAAFPFSSGQLPGYGALALIFMLALLTTALAFLLFLAGGRYVASSESALVALLDVVLGPLWVWLAFAEDPGKSAIAGGSIVMAAVVWYFWPSLRRPRS